MAGSLDSCFGPSFLKAPFWPQKGSFKGQKQPVINPFCNYIKWLLRSDPQPYIFESTVIEGLKMALTELFGVPAEPASSKH